LVALVACGGDDGDVSEDLGSAGDDDSSSSEVPSENAVHALEHGVVWITYDDVDDDTIECRVRQRSPCPLPAHREGAGAFAIERRGSRIA